MDTLILKKVLVPQLLRLEQVTMSTTNHKAHDVFLALHIVIVVPLCDRRDPAFIKLLAHPVSTYKEP